MYFSNPCFGVHIFGIMKELFFIMHQLSKVINRIASIILSYYFLFEGS